MDFVTDFTYFSMEEVLREARRLYGRNKYVCQIRLDKAATDRQEMRFFVTKPRHLTLTQLGLPLRFRNIPVVFSLAAND
ncbi:MAG: hypothetical protein HY080_04515 [Gammaproteobacteria bacterium]|nr:hypothetical protein [Gammaproteobacteria bacterium]